MSPEQEPSNAALMIKLGEISATLVGVQRQLDLVTGLPVKVAALESDMESVKASIVEIRQDREGGRSRVVSWAAFAAVMLGVMASLILGILQLAGAG